MLSQDRLNRIKELQNRSFERGIFTFSDFLSPTSLSLATEHLKKGEYTVFGGADFVERAMIRFGSEEEFGYSEEFPLSILKISVLGGKFASAVTHRDVLGATLNLGIERQKLGDIFINGTFCYLIAHKTVSKLILEELTSIGKNKVQVEAICSLPQSLAPTKKQIEFSVSSNRADAILCKVYNLSREVSCEYFEKELVMINGRPCKTPSKMLSIGDVVTARGLGKFLFDGEGGLSKKGKLYVTVLVYV